MNKQTFIHCEETLAQDVAAAPKLHPEPAVRGGDGLRGFIATEPTWEGKKNSQAESKRGLKQAKRSVPSNVVQGKQQTLLQDGHSHATCLQENSGLQLIKVPGV